MKGQRGQRPWIIQDQPWILRERLTQVLDWESEREEQNRSHIQGTDILPRHYICKSGPI